MSTLEIKGLWASVGEKEILKGIDLTVRSGEVHAVMGPNGAGKSTLSGVVMGMPGYDVTAGSVTLDGEDMLSMPTWQRAVAGLHLIMQYPTEVPGVMLDDVLVEALKSRERSSDGLEQLLRDEADRIGFDNQLLHRPLNVDLSGGEKKRNETLQLAVLAPKIAILDELDSGLDIDALRVIAGGVNALRGPERSMIVITHYQRLLDYIKPDFVHVLVDGRIVESGDYTLALQLEEHGYASFVNHDLDEVERPLTGAPS
jgi:Fe-S cluster assembly ATP-binding protein